MGEVIKLDKKSPSVKYLCDRDKRLGKVISMVGDLTYSLYEDSYQFLVDTVIGQMLSNKAADAISARLRVLCNGKVNSDTVEILTDEQIRNIGISHQKIGFIRGITEQINRGDLQYEKLHKCSDDEAIKLLTSLKGIGPWSAKMYLIFVLNRQDVLPVEDMAFLQAYGWAYKTEDFSAASVKKKCCKWSPYSSIAARYMYRALDSGLTNYPFHLHL